MTRSLILVMAALGAEARGASARAQVLQVVYEAVRLDSLRLSSAPEISAGPSSAWLNEGARQAYVVLPTNGDSAATLVY